MLVTDEEYNCPVYNVTYEPGVRTHWHSHPGGQILLVTGGNRYIKKKENQRSHLRKDPW
jgi:quercetin dioxygenase-like cupin family protein